MNQIICGSFGVIGSFLAYLLGGWDSVITTLFIFMVIDYISGLLLAGVFHASPKTESGTLASRTGWKGLTKKGMTLLFVVIAVRLDMILATNYIRDGVCIAFMVNEGISIIENAGIMGVPIPSKLKQAIEMLQDKGGD